VREVDSVLFGNAAGVRPAIERKATVVVSLCRMGTSDIPDDVEHLTVALIDTTLADNPNLAFVLADTARTVASLTDAGERVFVHCVAGENRTPTIAAAYLMARGDDRATALARTEAKFGRRPARFLIDGLADAESLLATDH
jgi:ADP-ribosyl-[dinitrogen reductase] hydrolase